MQANGLARGGRRALVRGSHASAAAGMGDGVRTIARPEQVWAGPTVEEFGPLSDSRF